MNTLFQGLSCDSKDKSKARKTCGFKRPMLATLTGKRFSDSKWIFEEKFDGVRCLVVKKGQQVTLYSRNRNKLNKSYPELVKAFKSQIRDFVVDGEIVAFEGKVTSFSKLQKRMHVKDPTHLMKRIKVYFYAFDMLFVDGWEITQLPLIDRKKVLKKALTFKSNLRYTTHRVRYGEKYFKEAEKKNWEGVIAKRAASLYVSKRSRDWLKFKCVKGEIFVIGGFTKPQGSRIGFGALLIGYPGQGKLRFAGRVGTGYDTALLKKLAAHLKRIKRKTSPFKDENIPTQNVTWVQPSLKAKIGFTERTKEGKLRHPRFLKLL